MIKTFTLKIRLIFLLSCSLNCVFNAKALYGNEIPIIKRVGVLPVQWQGDIDDLNRQDLIAIINEKTPQIVRDAKRFYVINDEIIDSYWNSPEGRSRLSEQFELDAYISLEANWSDNLLILDAKLKGKDLNTYMLESERLSESWVMENGENSITEVVRNLIYRLLNRYPLDLYVSSVQGRYITLSAGRSQSLSEGSEVDIYRYSIASIHPANSTWLSFDKKYLGRVQLVDVKTHSSVAMIKSLAYDNAIKIGDGARISDISSRKLFARADLNDKLWIKDKLPDTPIQPPIPISSAKEQTSKTAPAAVIKPKEQPAADSENFAPIAETNEKSPENSEIELSKEGEDSKWDWFGLMDSWEKIRQQNLKRFVMQFGLKLWSIEDNESNTKTSNSTPLWLVNYLGLMGHFDWGSSDFSDIGLIVHSGPTEKGTAVGFTLSGSYIKQLQFPGFLLDSNDGIEFGGKVNMGTLSVNGESYGGADTFELALLGGIHGRYHMTDSAQTIKYRTGIILDLLGVGKAGIPGTFVDIKGKVSYGIYGEAQLLPAQNDWLWGAFTKLSVGSYQTEGSSIAISEILLGVNAHIMAN